jgi:putative colanic acid biosynthesis acetyltransferase WcaF
MSEDEKAQCLNQFRLPPEFRGKNIFIVQLWWLVQSTIFGCSPQFLYGWRRFVLRLFGAKIGVGVIIRPSARVTYPWKLSIGDYSWIGDNVELYTLSNIIIEDNVVISQRSYLCTGSHNYRVKTFDIYAKPITVKSCAWVASDVFIHPGVVIGKAAVVGARSTVVQDLPDGMIASGSPAKVVRSRSA